MATLLETKLKEANLSEISDFLINMTKILDTKPIWDAINTEYVSMEVEKETSDNKWNIGDSFKILNHTAMVVGVSDDLKECICCLNEYWEEPIDRKSPFLLRLNTMIEADQKFMIALNNQVTILPWAEAAQDGKLYDRKFRVPYAEEMFNPNEIIQYGFDPFQEKSLIINKLVFWPQMIDSHNRAASRLNKPEAGWLMDRFKGESGTFYGRVDACGDIEDYIPSEKSGVRLVFRIKNEKEGCVI